MQPCVQLYTCTLAAVAASIHHHLHLPDCRGRLSFLPIFVLHIVKVSTFLLLPLQSMYYGQLCVCAYVHIRLSPQNEEQWLADGSKHTHTRTVYNKQLQAEGTAATM